jgi:hypothetical protein
MELEELGMSKIELIQAIAKAEESSNQNAAINSNGVDMKISIKPILRLAIVYR